MIFAVYLCSSGLIFLLFFFRLSLFNRADKEARKLSHQQRVYTVKSFIFIAIGLTLFILLSSWQGLLKFGVVTDFSFPQDYIEAGFVGWLIMAIGLVGILSPIYASRTAN